MKIISVSEAKSRLNEVLGEVDDFEQVYLTRNGEVAGVLVHPDEWEALKETLEILSNPALMAQIKASKRSRKTYTLKQVFGDLLS